MCYKISLSLRPLDIRYLHECNVFELKIRKKIGKFLMFCRSPSLSEDEFETFTGKLELTLDKALIVEDLNAKSDRWCNNDKAIHDGSKIANLASQSGLKQFTNQPTHISSNSTICIALLFTSKPI